MSETKKQQVPRNTIIGKNSLLITARGENEFAAQIFNYEQVREVRMDLKSKEIKILMSYDDSYYRIFQVFPENDTPEAHEEANQKLFKFYNDLLHATMKLTKEEVDNLNKQIEVQRKIAEEKALKEAKENEASVDNKIN